MARLLPLWELCCRDHADADASPPSRQYKWTQLTQAKAAKGRPFIVSRNDLLLVHSTIQQSPTHTQTHKHRIN